LPAHINFIIRFAVFAIIHSLLATCSAKQLAEQLHPVLSRFYRLLYNLLSLAMFAWVMAAYRHSPVIYFVPGAWSLLLYILQLAVLFMLFIALRQTGLRSFAGWNSSSDSTLVTGGFYGIVRHPLYLLSSLFLLLTPVMTAQWALLTILSVMYFLLGAIIEEKRMGELYGLPYTEYCRRVPFIIPNVRTHNDS